MVERIERARRIGGIALGAGKAVFRTGRAWGTTKTRVSTARRSAEPGRVAPAVAAGMAAGAAGGYFLDPDNGKRRRHVAADRARALVRRRAAEAERKARYAAGIAKGAAYEASGGHGAGEELADADLANKVRSEIFRDADAPKGEVNVNAENGVVFLRGELDSKKRIDELVKAAHEVAGVRDVVSLLHLPGEEAPAKEEKSPPARARKR